MITPAIDTLEPPLVCEDVQQQDLRRLAAVVVTQAIADAKNGNLSIEKRLDALLWLTGPDIGWWFEWAGVPFADPIALLTSGHAKTARTARRKNR